MCIVCLFISSFFVLVETTLHSVHGLFECFTIAAGEVQLNQNHVIKGMFY